MMNNTPASWDQMNVGGGYKCSLPVRFSDWTLSGAPLTTSNGDSVYAGNSAGQYWVAWGINAAGVGVLQFQLPLDYDSTEYDPIDSSSGDYLKVKLHIDCTSGSRDMTPDAAVYRPAGATAPTVSGLDDITVTDADQVIEVDLSGKGLRPGDTVNFTLTAENTTGVIVLYGTDVIYRSNLVATDPDDR